MFCGWQSPDDLSPLVCETSISRTISGSFPQNPQAPASHILVSVAAPDKHHHAVNYMTDHSWFQMQGHTQSSSVPNIMQQLLSTRQGFPYDSAQVGFVVSLFVDFHRNSSHLSKTQLATHLFPCTSNTTQMQSRHKPGVKSCPGICNASSNIQKATVHQPWLLMALATLQMNMQAFVSTHTNMHVHLFESFRVVKIDCVCTECAAYVFGVWNVLSCVACQSDTVGLPLVVQRLFK